MIYQDQYDCRQWQGSTITGVDADGIGSVSESASPKCYSHENIVNLQMLRSTIAVHGLKGMCANEPQRDVAQRCSKRSVIKR